MKRSYLQITQVHVLGQIAVELSKLLNGDFSLQFLTANCRRNQSFDAELFALLVSVSQILQKVIVIVFSKRTN